jgi:hypothetical protein
MLFLTGQSDIRQLASDSQFPVQEVLLMDNHYILFDQIKAGGPDWKALARESNVLV